MTMRMTILNLVRAARLFTDTVRVQLYYVIMRVIQVRRCVRIAIDLTVRGTIYVLNLVALTADPANFRIVTLFILFMIFTLFTLVTELSHFSYFSDFSHFLHLLQPASVACAYGRTAVEPIFATGALPRRIKCPLTELLSIKII
jgi:hypothetical protein